MRFLRRRFPEPTPDEMLERVDDQLHVLEGLVSALQRREVVLGALDEGGDVAVARRLLVERLGLDELQANAVLDLQLRRLTPAEVGRIEDDVRDLRARREELLRDRS